MASLPGSDLHRRKQIMREGSRSSSLQYFCKYCFHKKKEFNLSKGLTSLFFLLTFAYAPVFAAGKPPCPRDDTAYLQQPGQVYRNGPIAIRIDSLEWADEQHEPGAPHNGATWVNYTVKFDGSLLYQATNEGVRTGIVGLGEAFSPSPRRKKFDTRCGELTLIVNYTAEHYTPSSPDYYQIIISMF